MKSSSGLIILDRDGVLNQIVIDPEHGTIDSPMNPGQVKIISGVPQALNRLSKAGYSLAIASNQPAAAKGKTSLSNLQEVHQKVLSLVEMDGAVVSRSYICFHRAEDACLCRKPKTGLLKEAIKDHPHAPIDRSWMIGDGVTDIEAGISSGLMTAFLAPQKCDACRVLDSRNLKPTFWGDSLIRFVEYLLDSKA